MNDSSRPDLEAVRAQFSAWRATRKGHSHLPEALWEAALSLLDRYAPEVVCRTLALKPAFMRKRLGQRSGSRTAAPVFVELTPPLLAGASRVATSPSLSPDPRCRLQIERPDGARLTLQLPACDASTLEALVLTFARS